MKINQNDDTPRTLWKHLPHLSIPYQPNHAQYPPNALSRSISISIFPNDESDSTAVSERMAKGPKIESLKSRVQISLHHLTIAFFSCLSTIPGVTFFLREVCDRGAGLVLSSNAGLQRSQQATVSSMGFRGKFQN